jgi:hypothetical protein
MSVVNGEHSMSRSLVLAWHNRFREGDVCHCEMMLTQDRLIVSSLLMLLLCWMVIFRQTDGSRV